MNKISKTVLTVVLLIVFCFILTLVFPILREPMYLIWFSIVRVFEAFFMQDIIQEWGLYIVIAIVVFFLGGSISVKTERKIWVIVSIILDLILLSTLLTT